jgi:hypothetical protein
MTLTYMLSVEKYIQPKNTENEHIGVAAIFYTRNR